MRYSILHVAMALFTLIPSIALPAAIKSGDLITPENALLVADLVSPGNLVLVKQGMRMKIVPTGRLEWPPPYKAATEKYSAQTHLDGQGAVQNYVAGLPFPLLDLNDPQAATKVMWNFSFRPQYTDDADIRDVEATSYIRNSRPQDPFEHFVTGALLSRIRR